MVDYFRFNETDVLDTKTPYKMKKLALAFAGLLLFTFLSSHCAISGHLKNNREYSQVEILTFRDTIPVLIGKEMNPVLRINVRVPDDMHGLNISGISLKIAGSSPLGDISSVSILHTGAKNRFSDPLPFGESQSPASTMVFRARQSLMKGDNYFWVSFKISESANLSHKVAAGCDYVLLDEGIRIESAVDPSSFQNRIGIALRKHGDDGVDTYRIPGLVSTNKGTLIAVYDNRYNGPVDLQADVDVGMSRSTDGGKTWESMKVIMDMGEWGGLPQDQNGIGDPSILVDRATGTIWVAAIWAHGTPGKRNWNSSGPGISPEETSQLMLVRSDDDGQTWSDPINLTPLIKDPEWYLLLQGPGRGISISDGTIVFPVQYKDHEQMPHSTILWSQDHGESWHIGTGAKANTTEAQVIELEDGSLMMNMRDNRKGSRSVYTTSDLGKTWIKHASSRSALIEPVCNATLIKASFLLDGNARNLVLFANPNSITGRHHMTIKVSKDDGSSWPEKYWFLLDAGRGRGYPCMTQVDDEHVGILYEGSQADLVFEKIHIDEIIKTAE